MRLLILYTLLFFAFHCAPQQEAASSKQIPYPAYQTLLDSAQVAGAILLYDPQKDAFYSNDFEWCDKRRLPASTFKITNSIIALETGVVENDSTLFKWNGEKRALKNWEQDLTLKQAFHVSCVPCYQEVARKVGLKRMQHYLDTLAYGNMQFDSSYLDKFWLEGESGISQFEQIDFLHRFYTSQLPISERTESIMKDLMVIEETEAYKLSGKTGWAIRGDNNNGWFVGYIETPGKHYFFATNIEPGDGLDMDLFPAARKTVTYAALRKMGIIE
ncbi:MAG: class D beta-lactamase [Saprospiraceae bacterium]